MKQRTQQEIKEQLQGKSKTTKRAKFLKKIIALVAVAFGIPISAVLADLIANWIGIGESTTTLGGSSILGEVASFLWGGGNTTYTAPFWLQVVVFLVVFGILFYIADRYHLFGKSQDNRRKSMRKKLEEEDK